MINLKEYLTVLENSTEIGIILSTPQNVNGETIYKGRVANLNPDLKDFGFDVSAVVLSDNTLYLKVYINENNVDTSKFEDYDSCFEYERDCTSYGY